MVIGISAQPPDGSASREGARNDGGIWVARLVGSDRFFESEVLSSLVIFGSLPIGLTVALYVLRGDRLGLPFLTSHLLSVVIVVVSPFLIWMGVERIFPQFIEDISDLLKNPSDAQELQEKYVTRFAREHWYVAVPWTALVLSGFLFYNGVYSDLEVYGGFLDPVFPAYLLYTVEFGLLTGIGFHGVFLMVSLVSEISGMELEIDPLHPDNFGGMRTIGRIAVRGTVMFSLGSLALPYSFLIASEANVAVLAYVGVAIYMGTIALSFLYPTVKVYKRAEELREGRLRRYREEVRELQGKIQREEYADVAEKLTLYREVEMLRSEFADYRDVDLFPLSLSILSRFVGSFLLPFAFTIFETTFSY